MDVDDSLNLSSFPADVGDIGDSEGMRSGTISLAIPMRSCTDCPSLWSAPGQADIGNDWSFQGGGWSLGSQLKIKTKQF